MFSRAYEVDRLSELPGDGNGQRIYYPGASQTGGADGLIVKILPSDARAWIGVFAFGRGSGSGVTGVFSYPDPNVVCVVSMGDGYLVRSDDPSAWETVKCVPIMDVRLVEEHGLILFVNFTQIVGYDVRGRRWSTADLSWDGVQISEISGDTIRGVGWDAPSQRSVEFTVDIVTGHHVGGAKPRPVA